ncbi:MAG: primary-amine oxidase [Actinobacteria bacterium]|nr:primary-amine oxidase [Actinomycetota bacterium]
MGPPGSEGVIGRHPLDPLSAEELERAVTIMRGAGLLSDGVRIVLLELAEPDKEAVQAYEDDSPGGDAVDRTAAAVLRDSRALTTFEVDLSLGRGEVIEVRERADVQPAVTAGESAECIELVRAHPGFRAALAQRGLTDPGLVTIEAWGIGDQVAPAYAGRRLVWCPCWTRRHPGDNPYARPLEGVYAIADLDRMEVLEVEDHGITELAERDGNYTPDAVGQMRDDLKALEIVQPDGPSFVVDGWSVQWQNWALRVGFTPREGLVLHGIRYRDQGRERPVLYRASFSELFVPYGDPSPGCYRRNAFDIGEHGLGPLTNSLELGCDCLGTIRYFDVVLADDAGVPYTVRNAICLHEEDFGLLWKHTDASTGEVEVRRARRLVISSIATADNYEYAFYWYLYQDGTIECEVKLTGIVLTGGIADGDRPSYGRIVAPRVTAPNHQHFFNVRLDLDVDGSKNTVSEVHAEPAPDDENPYGGAFRRVATPLRSERDGGQLIEPLSGRYWRIENPGKRNLFGDPVAYKLIPGGNTGVLSVPGSSVRRRAEFIDKHLWVTPYAPDERFASGSYPNQTSRDTGLARWVEQDRPIEDADVVLWYTFGSTHLPRPEDWPVMPVERIGFLLKPDGFFDRSPAIDVPPSLDSCSKSVGDDHGCC